MLYHSAKLALWDPDGNYLVTLNPGRIGKHNFIDWEMLFMRGRNLNLLGFTSLKFSPIGHRCWCFSKKNLVLPPLSIALWLLTTAHIDGSFPKLVVWFANRQNSATSGEVHSMKLGLPRVQGQAHVWKVSASACAHDRFLLVVARREGCRWHRRVVTTKLNSIIRTHIIPKQCICKSETTQMQARIWAPTPHFAETQVKVKIREN